ncbi:MAG: hypothetical protein HZC50_07820 [Nitrospirae bacterium]|nr:hypothetical protein [Nitrospirota bacterium]
MASDGLSTVPRQMQALYADVIVPRHIAKAFTYLIPPTLAQTLVIGHRVLVPFGRMVLEGVVISLSNHLATEIQSTSLREIRSLAHDGPTSTLSPALFELSRKIADYYVAPWGQCLRLVLPSIADSGPNCPTNSRDSGLHTSSNSTGKHCAGDRLPHQQVVDSAHTFEQRQHRIPKAAQDSHRGRG